VQHSKGGELTEIIFIHRFLLDQNALKLIITYSNADQLNFFQGRNPALPHKGGPHLMRPGKWRAARRKGMEGAFLQMKIDHHTTMQ
jgi:hypothetical protein